MAGLHKDKRTGIYTVQFYDADRSPKRKQVSTGTRDFRTARRLHRRWEAAYAEGRYDPWTDPPPEATEARLVRTVTTPTLAEARDAFLLSRSHLASNTRLNYERVTRWYVEHAGGDRPIATVNSDSVTTWLNTRDVRPVSKANYLRHLRAFVRFCVERGWAASDVTDDVGLERVPRQFPKALRPDQVEAVAAYAERHCRDGEERSAAWAAQFVRLGAETAMRRNGLHLRWDHVDLERGHLTVACTDAFTSKSGAERRIPLSSRAASVLDDLGGGRSSPSGLVLVAGRGRGVHPGTCSKTVKRFAVAAGVPDLTPHVLRHSSVTWLIERGVPVPVVQRFAGHADVATTMLYCSVADDVAGDRIRSALDGPG
ncbi:tyrosine-type recombinase/integrase [Rubrivirga marina]|uniref:Tyr recombinase domain-containing protein n=1 Tax=Rubrivirga marina TaxID=1196024 RepID=A0A271J187_9BACT|nr:site-specific integrase [Rubrivirga marina]PAP77077.1 hypothetical protein BSZ37_11890 [Rubrivirga marina]